MKKNIKFEEAMQLLEDSVKRLESGTLTLDESLETFEEAVSLVKICNERLDAAEQRVRILTAGEDGTVTDVPLDKSDYET